MPRQLNVSGGCFWAALLFGHLSLAGHPPAEPASVSPSAQAAFERGVAAYAEGRFRDAVELFKEADRLAPSARLSFNVAKVYERTGDNRSALAAYRDYLRRLPAADNVAEVKERVVELERSLEALGVQQLSVLSTPAGATLLIDDVSRGVTPWTGELSPGAHQLTLRLHSFRDAVRKIDLPAQRAIDVEVQLIAAADEPAAATPPKGPALPGAELGSRAPLPTQPAELAPLPHWWTWALFGGSAAFLVGAGAFEVARRNMEERAQDSVEQIEHEARFEVMERRQTAARVFLGVGVLAGLAGGVSLYLDLAGAHSEPTDIAFGCDVGGCQLLAEGEF